MGIGKRQQGVRAMHGQMRSPGHPIAGHIKVAGVAKIKPANYTGGVGLRPILDNGFGLGFNRSLQHLSKSF